MISIWIPGEITTLNDYIAAERTSRYMAAQIKRFETYQARYAAWSYPAYPGEYPVLITFEWARKSRKSDPDNVAFAAKFVLDGLVEAGIILGDGWKYIAEIQHTFRVDKDAPGVKVIIAEAR